MIRWKNAQNFLTIENHTKENKYEWFFIRQRKFINMQSIVKQVTGVGLRYFLKNIHMKPFTLSCFSSYMSELMERFISSKFEMFQVHQLNTTLKNNAQTVIHNWLLYQLPQYQQPLKQHTCSVNSAYSKSNTATNHRVKTLLNYRELC